MMRRTLKLALALCVTGGWVSAQQPPAAPPAPAATNLNSGLLRATLVTLKRELDVYLLERKGEDIFYRPPNVPAGVMAQVRLSEIQDAQFALDLDEAAIFNAERERKWLAAAQLILPKVTPALPFLDLPGNNAADAALDAGRHLYRAARTFSQAGGEANIRYAQQRYTQARELLDRVAAVTWFPGSAEARLRSVQCLVDLGKLDDAGQALERVLEPEPAAAEFGLYWLTRANLHVANQEMAAAADAAARSLAFQNKDMETFVEASLLSARCCEDLLDMHRARDIYYEVARLFAGTEAGDRAKARLDYIMRNGLTKEKEAVNVAKVFFGSEEDLDALARDFLSGKASAKPEPTESKGDTKP